MFLLRAVHTGLHCDQPVSPDCTHHARCAASVLQCIHQPPRTNFQTFATRTTTTEMLSLIWQRAISPYQRVEARSTNRVNTYFSRPTQICATGGCTASGERACGPWNERLGPAQSSLFATLCMYSLCCLSDCSSFETRRRSGMEYQRKQPELSAWEILRRSVHMWYQGDIFQISVAICIFFNFISQAAEAQIQPTAGSEAEHVMYFVKCLLYSAPSQCLCGILGTTHVLFMQVFEVIELIFLAIFCAELAINMFATLWWPFFMSGEFFCRKLCLQLSLTRL